MNIKEKFEQIKKLVFAVEPVAPVEPQPEPIAAPEKLEMTAYKLQDGTEVMVDKLEVGGMVMVGEVTAPDGTMTFEDGTEVTTVAGMITEIEAKEEAPVAPVAPVADAQMQTLKAEVANFQTQLKAQSEATAKLVELVEFLINEPKVAPTEKQKSFEEMTPLERFRLVRKNITKQ